MSLSKLLPAALIAVMAAAALPAVAQDAPPPPAKSASIKLDFGAGRKVDIKCGEATLEACIAAATPMIEKVASTPAPHPIMRGHGWKRGDKAGERGQKGERHAPPPPAEAEAAPPPAN